MPIRVISTFHSLARLLISAYAASTSASWLVRSGGILLGRLPVFLVISSASASRWFICFSNPSRVSSVGCKRYFSTNALIPCAARASATSQPSLPMESHINPPPGATITLVPLALFGSARKGVKVALVILRAMGSPHCRNQDSCAGWSATPPVFSGIARGSSGASIGYILPS